MKGNILTEQRNVDTTHNSPTSHKGSRHGTRGKRLGFLALVFLLLLIAFPFWMTWREVQQQHRNHALITAIQRNDTDTALALLEQGADANTRLNSGETISFWQRLLNKLRRKPETPNTSPTALLVALHWKENRSPGEEVLFPPENLALVKALLQHGAKVNLKDTYDNPPLFYAIMAGKNATIHCLLDGGADVKTSDFVHPLSEAVMNPEVNEDVITAMLDRGADINERNSIGDTPLIDATRSLRVEVVRILIARHADVTIKGYQGETAMVIAQQYPIIPQNQQILEMLKKAGAKK